MRSVAPLLILPLSAAAQTITGTIFQDYNANGIRDVDSPGFYEGGAANIPVELHACQNDMQILTYSDDEGFYSFELTEGCYYVYMGDSYSVGPYVQPGDVTQMVTNQVYPGSLKSVEVNLSSGQVQVVNVGIVTKTSVAAVQETSTTTTEVITTSSTTSAEMTTTSSTTENYSEAFFSPDDNDVDSTADVVDTDDFSDVVDTVENSTNYDDGVAFVGAIDSLDSTTAATDAVEETAFTNAESLFGGSEETIVEPSTSSGGDASNSSTTAATGVIYDTSSTAPAESSASFNESSNSTDFVTESSSTVAVDSTAAADEETPSAESTFEGWEETENSSTKNPTSSPTASKVASSEEEADKSEESGKESSGADATVSTTDEETVKETADPKPTATPTAKPTTCIGCELSLSAKVRIQLDNIDSSLSDDSKSLFESVCASFLEEQLSIATPPISDLNCVLVEESFESQALDRSLRDQYRMLSQLYLADVEITGKALSTQSHQTPESIKLKELCVGTFTVQGFLFVRALKEAEEEASSDVTVFQSVENARGVMTYDASEATSGEQIDDPSNPDGGSLSTGAMAAIAAGSAFCAVCFLLFIAVKARNKCKNRYNDIDERSGSANKSGKGVDSTIYDEFPELNKNGTAKSSPTNSQGSGPTLITPVSITSNTEEVEVDMIPSGFSGDQKSKVSSMLNSRVRRDVMAPPGKLGIMVANTAGFGPAVHTMRDGSPMEGLIFVNDIIIAINGVNTREYTATQITQMMKDTVDEERTITVLSSVQ